MLKETVSVWDAEKTCRRPRTTITSNVNSISVDWDSMCGGRRARTENSNNTAIKMAAVEERVVFDDFEEPGAMSLTNREIRDMMRLA